MEIEGNKAIFGLAFHVIVGDFDFFSSRCKQRSCHTLTVFIGEVIKREAHFLYREHEGIFVFGSQGFVFRGLRFRYNPIRI